MIWKALLRIARAQLRRWSPAFVAAELITEVSEEVTESVYPAVFPSARPPPLPDPLSTPKSYADVARQERDIHSAARAFPPVTSSIPHPASNLAAPTLDTLPFVERPFTAPPRPPPPPVHTARASAAPPPIMPPPVRPQNRPQRKR